KWGKQAFSLSSVLSGGHQDVPFSGITAIDLTANQPVVLPQNAFTVTGLSGNYALSGPTLVGNNIYEYKLTTTLAATTGYDNIQLTLAGFALPTWAPETKAGFFRMLIGDVDGNGVVDTNDQLGITQHLVTKYSGLSYFDVDGDGTVSMSDYYIAR